MHKLEYFKEFIEDELDKIRKKGDLTPAELENADKAVDILKDIFVIEGMKIYEESPESYGEDSYGAGNYRNGYRAMNYSRMMPDMRYGNYYDNYGGAYGESYNGQYGARRRNSRGRYMDGYSARNNRRYGSDEAKDKMTKYLESKLLSASTDEEKDIIRRCMDEIEMA